MKSILFKYVLPKMFKTINCILFKKIYRQFCYDLRDYILDLIKQMILAYLKISNFIGVFTFIIVINIQTLLPNQYQDSKTIKCILNLIYKKKAFIIKI